MDGVDVILFTDVNGSIGFGRYAGAYRIATEIRNLGYSVQVIDFCMSFSMSEVLIILLKYMNKNTKFVGISSTFLVGKETLKHSTMYQRSLSARESTSIGWTKKEFKYIAEHIKCISNDCKIVIGGSKLKHDMPLVDEYVAGEGEYFIKKFFKDDTPFLYNQSKITWEENDHIFHKEHLPIEIARGCIFKCSFCAYPLNGKKQGEYVKNPNTVKEEILDNYNKFNTTGYMFCDDTYNDHPTKIKMYHKMITSLPFEINFSTYMRLDLIEKYPDTIDLLYESGCRSVFFGIETFNRKVGKNIGKGADPIKLKELLYKLKERWPATIISAGFIIGLPYETEKSIYETIEWLEKKNCPIDAPSYTVLHVGTTSKIGKDPFAHGIELIPTGWKSKWLSSNKAQQIIDTTTSPIINNFTFYNRIKNLNIQNRIIKNNSLQIITSKYNTLFETYKNKILT